MGPLRLAAAFLWAELAAPCARAKRPTGSARTTTAATKTLAGARSATAATCAAHSGLFASV